MKSFLYKFSLISRYLQISTMPCIISRNQGSWEEFVEKFFWGKLVHNFVVHNVPIVTDDIFYVQPGTRPTSFNRCVVNYAASSILKTLESYYFLFVQATPNNITISQMTFNKTVINTAELALRQNSTMMISTPPLAWL